MSCKKIPIRFRILYPKRHLIGGMNSDEIERYVNDPVPKLHTDILQEIVNKVEGITSIELELKETPPFQDTYYIEFSSYTKMVKAIRKLDNVFGILYDGKMLIDLNENKIMIQF